LHLTSADFQKLFKPISVNFKKKLSVTTTYYSQKHIFLV